MSQQDAGRRLDLVIAALARHGAARCGSGFGKYPLGIREAIDQLLPLLDEPHPQVVTDAVAAFDKRLNQP